MNEEDVKSIIAWGSLSYAFGFVTVTLHTWRLGLPVLELLKAVYIWIGLPLALAALFALRLRQRIRQEGQRLVEDLNAYSECLTGETRDHAKEVSESLGKLLSELPLVTPLAYFSKVLIARAAEAVQSKPNRMARTIANLALFLAGIVTVSRFLRLLASAVSVVLCAYVYVWIIYPQVPQSLGGGRPAKVQLLIQSAEMPSLAIALPGVSLQSVMPTPGATALTQPLDLLYRTKDDYYLRASADRCFSLKKEAVAAIIWDP